MPNMFINNLLAFHFFRRSWRWLRWNGCSISLRISLVYITLTMEKNATRVNCISMYFDYSILTETVFMWDCEGTLTEYIDGGSMVTKKALVELK